MYIALAAAGLAALVAFPAFAQGQAVVERAFPATLAGHAVLPAATFAPPPQGAPPGFALSGRFAGPGNLRVDQPGSIAGSTGTAPTPARPGSPSPSRASRCRASRASSRSPASRAPTGC